MRKRSFKKWWMKEKYNLFHCHFYKKKTFDLNGPTWARWSVKAKMFPHQSSVTSIFLTQFQKLIPLTSLRDSEKSDHIWLQFTDFWRNKNKRFRKKLQNQSQREEEKTQENNSILLFCVIMVTSLKGGKWVCQGSSPKCASAIILIIPVSFDWDTSHQYWNKDGVYSFPCISSFAKEQNITKNGCVSLSKIADIFPNMQ